MATWWICFYSHPMPWKIKIKSQKTKRPTTNFSWVVCAQKNALSNSAKSFCSEGKDRRTTRNAWGESKFDRVAKTLFPIDFWRNLPWSSHRLLRCLCHSASCQESFLVICHQCNRKKNIHLSISASTLLLHSVLQGCWSQRWGYTLDQSEHRRTNDHPTPD